MLIESMRRAEDELSLFAIGVIGGISGAVGFLIASGTTNSRLIQTLVQASVTGVLIFVILTIYGWVIMQSQSG
jgi:hypothetical protein